jgi:hypothetical protein
LNEALHRSGVEYGLEINVACRPVNAIVELNRCA